MKSNIITAFLPTYFLLSMVFPFLMLLEGNYYLHLNFNGIIILNFVFILLGVFIIKPITRIDNFEKGLLLLTATIFINLLIHGTYREEWRSFSYVLSVTLIAIIFKHIERPKNTLILALYIPLFFALSIATHLFLAYIHGYTKLGFTNNVFANPGHFSSFLMAYCPVLCSIGYFKKSEIKADSLLKNLCFIVCGITFLIVVFNNTRTSWMSALIISSIYHWIWQSKKNKNADIRPSISIDRIMQIAFSILLFAIASYSIKKDSSDGRSLIWKLSTKIIQDNPLTGVGFNRFDGVYNLYQSDYFKTHNDPRAAWLADNVLVAYNEFLQLLAELGLIALLPILYFLVYATQQIIIIFKKKLNAITIRDMGFVGLVTVVFLQMFFSYPFRITEITNAIFLNYLYLTLIEE